MIVGPESGALYLVHRWLMRWGKALPIRKKGKLPYKTVGIKYELEYGTDELEIHEDAISPGQKVLIVDDLLATGGTTQSNVKLVEKLGGKVVGLVFFIELGFLNGRERLKGYEVRSVVSF